MVHQGGREQCTKNLSVPKVFISIYISDVSEILQGCPLNFAWGVDPLVGSARGQLKDRRE